MDLEKGKAEHWTDFISHSLEMDKNMYRNTNKIDILQIS